MGSSAQEFSPGKPRSSVEALGFVETYALPMMSRENFGHIRRPQQNQVYVRRRTLGLTSSEDNEGSARNAEAVGSEAISTPDTSLALLAPMSSSPAVDDIAQTDPPRFEADIACQLYRNSFSSLVRDDCVPP